MEVRIIENSEQEEFQNGDLLENIDKTYGDIFLIFHEKQNRIEFSAFCLKHNNKDYEGRYERDWGINSFIKTKKTLTVRLSND